MKFGKYTRLLSRLFLTAGLFSSASAWSMICSTDANQAIDDGSGSATPGAAATISITVPAVFTNPITDLDFQLQINHTYVGDLIVTLQSPSGTVVTLLDRPGAPIPNSPFGCSGNNVDVTLDDEAATAAENQCAAAVPTMSGTHTPTGLLSSFDGEIPAGTWTLSATDNAGQDLGTVIAVNNCLDLTTVPVVLSAFETRQRGRSLIAEWQTSSEAFNLGFDLWGEVDDEWVQLNKRLVASREFDSVEPQSYKHRIRLNSLSGDISAVGISSLSTAGREEFFGPFAIGEKYGQQTIPRKIDWAEQRAVYSASMLQAGYIELNGRWVKPSKKRVKRLARWQKRYPRVLMEITEPGVYKLTYEELLASGFDLQGLPINKLSVSREGRAVPRFVTGSARRSKRFGPGAEIVFYADGPNSEQARYVDNARYLLSFDAQNVLRAPKVAAPDPNEATINYHHTQTQRVGEPKTYSFILPGEQPWFDSSVPAYRQVGRKQISFDVAETASLERGSRLTLNLLGGIDFPRQDADGDGDLEPHHHFKVYLNRAEFPEPIHEGYANGFNPIQLDIDTLSQLRHGENLVEFELIPDNGFNLDAAYFIDAGVHYQVATNADTLTHGFAMEDPSQLTAFKLNNTSSIKAYSYDDNGNFAELGIAQIDTDTAVVKAPESPALETTANVWLADYLTPRALLAQTSIADSELDLSEVDYVVISDPSLVGADLQRFVDRQAELGRRAKVVSSKAIFDRYSNGLVLPSAIADYLKDQAEGSPYQYVLLVGGHTYNYRGFNVGENEAPINLIPSFYREGEGLTRQIPTAVPFVDFDFDGAPDRAIGRWPVRNVAQLKKVVGKTLTWHADGSHKDSKSTLLIAGAKESLNEFTGSSERVYSSLGNILNPWVDPAKVYMDEINADDSIEPAVKLTTARQRLVEAINQGAALTVFNGHASPTSWSNQSLMTADIAEQLTNKDKPSLMMPLACYTTYYETPNVKSLAELLLTDNEAGAVALTSASLLSRTLDNENFAKAVLKDMTVKGIDLGTAVLNVKRTTHANGGRHQAVVYNMTLLGDPTLSFALPNVTLPPVVDRPKEQ